jgi:hypothetical protein
MGAEVAPELSAPPPVRYTAGVRVRSCLAAVLAVSIGLLLATAPAAMAEPAAPPLPAVTTLDPASGPEPAGDHQVASLAALGGIYAGLSTWAYFAWYYNVPNLQSFKVGGDGYFGVDTYAGGADKMGHAWANYALARGTTSLLTWGGWKPLPASAIASGLAWSFFLFVEIKDGYYYQLSPGDMIGNTLGAALSMAMVNWPALDDAIDFRVQYYPSDQYLTNLREDGDIDIAEDYSGQTYLLALHLSALPNVRNYGVWKHLSRYLDVAVGFETRGYKPDEPADTRDRRQSMYVGLSLNMQGLIDDLLEESPSTGARVTRKISHGIFEVFNAPFTTLPVAKGSLTPDD